MDIALLACRRHQVADAEAERAQTAKKQSKQLLMLKKKQRQTCLALVKTTLLVD